MAKKHRVSGLEQQAAYKAVDDFIATRSLDDIQRALVEGLVAADIERIFTEGQLKGSAIAPKLNAFNIAIEATEELRRLAAALLYEGSH